MKLLEIKNNKPFRVIEDDSVQLGDKTFVLDRHGKRFKDKIVLVDTPLVERLWKNDSLYVGPGPQYENSIGNRIENFKEWYQNNDNIEVGNAHVSARRNLMSFGDGRHRTRVLIELGYPQIPLQMSNDAIRNLEQMTVSESKKSDLRTLLKLLKRHKTKRDLKKTQNSWENVDGHTDNGPSWS